MEIKLKFEKLLLDLTEKKNNKVGKIKYRQCGNYANISLYKRGLTGKKVIAAFGDSVVLQSFRRKNILFFYPQYCSCIRKRIVLSRNVFPGLISGSNIDQVMLLPYMRDLGKGRYAKQLRRLQRRHLSTI